MDQYEIYRIIAPLAALPAIWAFVAAVRHRARASLYLQGFILCAIFVLVSSFLELSSSGEASILLFSRFGYVFIAFLPVFWLAFSFQYGIGRSTMLTRLFAALSVVPALTSLFSFLDPCLHLIWVQRSLEDHGRLRINVVYAYGPWFWVHFVYSYLLFIVGAVIILKEFLGHYDLYRRQACLVVSATGLPMVFNAIYVFRLVPGLVRDYSPIAISLSGILFTIGILKFRLLELNPLPRDRLGDFIDEGILVVDAKGLISYCNAVGARIIGRGEPESLLCRNLHDILPLCPVELIERASNSGSTFELTIAQGTDLQKIEFSAKSIDDAGRDRAWFCVVLRARRELLDPSSSAIDLLSKREAEIAAMLGEDTTIKEIAARLFLSENTVKTHIRHIYKKTGTKTRQELTNILSAKAEDR